MSPPWLKELEKAPKSQVIVGSIVGATVLATVLWGIQTASSKFFLLFFFCRFLLFHLF